MLSLKFSNTEDPKIVAARDCVYSMMLDIIKLEKFKRQKKKTLNKYMKLTKLFMSYCSV